MLVHKNNDSDSSTTLYTFYEEARENIEVIGNVLDNTVEEFEEMQIKNIKVEEEPDSDMQEDKTEEASE